jgi:hypothetical protein
MATELEVNNPLLQELAELRAEVNQLIDEQVAYVKERVEDLSLPRPLRATPLPIAGVSEPPEESVRGRTLDPRQRLDALAKHLDHRLRLANVPTTERVERSPGPEE